VVDTDGQRLSPGRSAGRTALKLVPWELAHFVVWQISFAANQSSPVYAFGFLLVWLLVAANLVSLLVSPRDQTLYDLVTRTQVLHCRSPLT
jgi:uncharacterized RDD family membrane protein YckC